MSDCGRLTATDLKRRQELPLGVKVNLTKARIRQWYEHYHGDVYVSYSGGKDSTVLLHIVRGVYPDVPAVFCDTGLEYPEVRKIALENADVVLKPKMNFKQVIEKYGYPFPSKNQASYIYEYKHTNSEKLRDYRLNSKFSISNKWKFLIDAPFEVSDKCCDVMKKKPFHAYEKETGRKPFIGTMADDSILRFQEYIQHGCNAFNLKRAKSTPLGFWTEQDVLKYISIEGLEYPSVYGDILCDGGMYRTTGVKSTGCMFCMFGVQMEKSPNRFQKMQITHPKQHAYCMSALGIGNVLDYLQIPKEMAS